MTDTKPSARPWLVAVVIAAELAFLVYFFSLDLPNSGPLQSRVSRLRVWKAAIGFSEPVLAIEALKAILQVESLSERAGVVMLSSLIVAASLAIGFFLLWLAGFAREGDKAERVAAELTGSPHTAAALTRSELVVLAYGLGMSVLSLAVLALGLAGWFNRMAWLAALIAICCAATVGAFWWRLTRSDAKRTTECAKGHSTGAAHWLVPSTAFITGRFAGAVAIALFLVISLFGALLPATDFDVREYHLQAPKEFFEFGRIRFLPHNVYGNMPFGSEMLSLLGMIVAGDWWWGALVGQVVLAGFAPMTALGISALGRRLFSARAGWFGALIYLTTPWVYRISIIPYTENALCFFLLAATLAVRCAWQQSQPARAIRIWLIAGALAGSAAACKYPALVSTVMPLGLAAICLPMLRRRFGFRPCSLTSGSLMCAGAFAAGVALTFGPWTAKNWFMTANPVYPLLYRVFDGRNWTPEKNAKWEWGHRVSLLVALGIQRPPEGQQYYPNDPQTSLSGRRLRENIVDVTAQADWQSPLVFGFAPLALLWPGRRRAALVLWLFVVFLFLQWWLLTHRLDRFWVPLLPVASVLAGAGVSWNPTAIWRRTACVIVALCVFFNFSFCTTKLCGNNLYSASLHPRRDPIDAAVNWLNDNLPPGARLLAVGAADLFHLDRPVVYNTVFDDCILEQWLKDGAMAQDTFVSHGITHVYVNWAWIHRYREPGNYGYTEFVRPELFRELVRNGILRPGVGAMWGKDEAGPIPRHELFVVIDKAAQ